MVPVAPIITGIIFVFTFRIHCISVARAVYFRNFSVSFLITLLLLLLLLCRLCEGYLQLPETNRVSRVYSIASIP